MRTSKHGVMDLKKRKLESIMVNPDDTLQLVLESQTEEEKSFYEMVGDFLLQNKQRESIARNVF